MAFTQTFILPEDQAPLPTSTNYPVLRIQEEQWDAILRAIDTGEMQTKLENLETQVVNLNSQMAGVLQTGDQLIQDTGKMQTRLENLETQVVNLNSQMARVLQTGDQLSQDLESISDFEEAINTLYQYDKTMWRHFRDYAFQKSSNLLDTIGYRGLFFYPPEGGGACYSLKMYNTTDVGIAMSSLYGKITLAAYDHSGWKYGPWAEVLDSGDDFGNYVQRHGHHVRMGFPDNKFIVDDDMSPDSYCTSVQMSRNYGEDLVVTLFSAHSGTETISIPCGRFEHPTLYMSVSSNYFWNVRFYDIITGVVREFVTGVHKPFLTVFDKTAEAVQVKVWPNTLGYFAWGLGLPTSINPKENTRFIDGTMNDPVPTWLDLRSIELALNIITTRAADFVDNIPLPKLHSGLVSLLSSDCSLFSSTMQMMNSLYTRTAITQEYSLAFDGITGEVDNVVSNYSFDVPPPSMKIIPDEEGTAHGEWTWNWDHERFDPGVKSRIADTFAKRFTGGQYFSSINELPYQLSITAKLIQTNDVPPDISVTTRGDLGLSDGRNTCPLAYHGNLDKDYNMFELWYQYEIRFSVRSIDAGLDFTKEGVFELTVGGKKRTNTPTWNVTRTGDVAIAIGTFAEKIADTFPLPNTPACSTPFTSVKCFHTITQSMVDMNWLNTSQLACVASVYKPDAEKFEILMGNMTLPLLVYEATDFESVGISVSEPVEFTVVASPLYNPRPPIDLEQLTNFEMGVINLLMNFSQEFRIEDIESRLEVVERLTKPTITGALAGLAFTAAQFIPGGQVLTGVLIVGTALETADQISRGAILPGILTGLGGAMGAIHGTRMRRKDYVKSKKFDVLGRQRQRAEEFYTPPVLEHIRETNTEEFREHVRGHARDFGQTTLDSEGPLLGPTVSLMNEDLAQHGLTNRITDIAGEVWCKTLGKSYGDHNLFSEHRYINITEAAVVDGEPLMLSIKAGVGDGLRVKLPEGEGGRLGGGYMTGQSPMLYEYVDGVPVPVRFTDVYPNDPEIELLENKMLLLSSRTNPQRVRERYEELLETNDYDFDELWDDYEVRHEAYGASTRKSAQMDVSPEGVELFVREMGIGGKLFDNREYSLLKNNCAHYSESLYNAMVHGAADPITHGFLTEFQRLPHNFGPMSELEFRNHIANVLHATVLGFPDGSTDV